MASPSVFSAERNWNRLGLSGFKSGKPAQYVSFTEVVPMRSRSCWTEVTPREISDEELLRMAEADGHFAFLEDPAEDIYTWEDGEEL